MDKPYKMMRGKNMAQTDDRMTHKLSTENPHLDPRPVNHNEIDIEHKMKPVDDDNGKSKWSWRKCCSFVMIILLIIGMIALVALGIVYFPPKKKPSTLNCDIDFSKGNTDNKCTETYSEKLKSVALLKIYFHGEEHHNGAINLQTMTANTYGSWKVQKMKNDVISIEMNTTDLTCNDAGIYLVQYQDSNGNVIYQQSKTIYVNANLSPIQVTTTPHLTKDGLNKSIMVEATMSIGCRHGTLSSILMKGDRVVFVEKSSCVSSFDNNLGGKVTCTTDIPESVWNSVDKFVTELQPNTDLPSHIQPVTIKKSDVNIGEICKQAYLVYGNTGIVNCKKNIDGAVAIDIYHQSSFFGNEKYVIGETSGKSKEAQNGRVKLESSVRGDLLDITLTFKNAHCDDQGNLTIKFSDKAMIKINVEVQGISQLCEESRSYTTSENTNFELECSWCPGHNVSEVTISHIEDVTTHTFHKPSGNVYPPYPVKIDMTKDVTTGGNVNLTILATIEHGLLKININAYRTACNYDEYYLFKASSSEGESEKLVNVTMEAPSPLFTDELKVPAVFVQDNEAKVTFQGFLGCFPSAIEVKKDGTNISPQSVLQYDDVRARIVKIEWLFDPVDKTKHDKNKLTAEVTFTRASGITNTYYKETSIEVLDNTLCSGKGPNPKGCLVQHPTDNKRYVTCSPALTITSITTCPSGLVFKPDGACSGQCDYPTTNGKK